MRFHRIVFALVIVAGAGMACESSREPLAPEAPDARAAPAAVSSADAELASFIGEIQAVDNHAHVNTIDTDDQGADALPLELLLPFEIPVRLRESSPDWLAAYRALYGYSGAELDPEGKSELMNTMDRVAREKGEAFPAWALDRAGIEVMLANRLAMGPGLAPPRFRWVAFVDALLLPLSTRAEEAVSPDHAKLFPVLAKQLKDLMADLGVNGLPPTLDSYLSTVVTPTLESYRKRGCLAVKFEMGFLRSLAVADVPVAAASKVYARHVAGGEPSHEEFKAITDFLFRYMAREAGRLGMPVHIHAFHGPGGFYQAAGSDPLLLEPVFNDPALRQTEFVIIHGGGIFANHTEAMLWKPNVHADISALTRLWPASKLAAVLASWLRAYPEKVLFGTDAASFGPGLGWELGAWIATTSARESLALALTQMLRHGEVSRERAQEIATMVMRTNAAELYGLEFP